MMYKRNRDTGEVTMDEATAERLLKRAEVSAEEAQIAKAREADRQHRREIASKSDFELRQLKRASGDLY